MAISRPRGPVVQADHEHDRGGDGHDHVGQRSDRVHADALGHAQQPVGELEVGERPQSEHRDQEGRGVAVAEDEPRQRPGQQRRARRTAIVVVSEQEADRAAGERVAALGILVGEVKAQEGLDHPEADDDAGEDDRVGEQLDHAIAAGVDVARVDGQQQDRHDLGDQVGDLVGNQRAGQALEITGHGRTRDERQSEDIRRPTRYGAAGCHTPAGAQTGSGRPSSCRAR